MNPGKMYFLTHFIIDSSKQEIYMGVNDFIADKNVVTKIMNNSTGLQRISLNGFA